MSTSLPALALITFGIWEAFFLFAIIALLFGAKKLPQLARGLGLGIRNFKGELEAGGEESDDEELS